jgi:hypothetical protein
MQHEIKLGPITFEWSAGEMAMRVGDTLWPAIELPAPEWEDFCSAAAMGATVILAMDPEAKDLTLHPLEAREKAARARHEQTMQMLGALQFQITMLTMSLGAMLGRPDQHDVLRKDVADMEAQAKETGRFLRRLLYVRARES